MEYLTYMRCRKLRLLPILTALLLMLGCMSAMASVPKNIAFALQGDKVRIGYIEDYGISTDPETGQPSGYNYEYMQEISKRTGWSCEYIPVTWSQGLEMLSSGELDLFGPMQKSPRRELLYDFPTREMGLEYGAIYVDISEDRFFYEDLSSLDGATIGIEEDTYYNSLIDAYCAENNISVTYKYTTSANVSRSLKNHEFDAFVGGGFFDIPDTVVIAKIAIEPYYYATTKGNTRILNELNFALDQIFYNNAYFSSDLYRKHFGDKSINMPACTREEADFISTHPTLTVACDSHWAPLEYYDRSSNSYRGINIDIMEVISEVSGINFEFLHTANYEESKALARSGEVDLLLGYTNTAATDLDIWYSNSFTDIPVMLVGRNSIDLSTPLNVAIREENSPLSIELKEQYPHFNYIEYPTSDDVVAALVNYEVDASFLSAYVFDEFARSQPLDKYIAIPTKISFPQGIGVSRSLPPTALNVINKAISRIGADRISTIVFANTVGRAYTMPLSRVLKEYSYIIFLALLLLLLLFLYISRYNQKNLEKLAYVDSLTGVSTMTRFVLDVQSVIKNAKPYEYMLVALDIDDFKYINDSFGYGMGNRILIAVTQHFRRSLAAGELMGRNNADNFVFLIKCASAAELELRSAIIDDVNRGVETILPDHYSISFSVGSYHITDIAEDISLMLDKANFARKSVKGNHNVFIAEYTEQMNSQMEWKKEVTVSMELALKSHEFEVYLQPKYLLRDETLIGAEALIRWQHPTKGLLPPFRFISIFEQNGFIRKLDIYVFEQVCVLLKRWREQNMPIEQMAISVNLSRMHLFNPMLVDELLALTDRYGISPSMIEVELTESIVFHNTTLLIDIMNRLHSSGFSISIDDFGSGYSSLNLLKDLPVDILKIDKGFLSDSADVTNGRVIIDSVTKMAKSLNLITVAEGVETKEQAEMLLGMGCDIAQGYYYAKPMPVADFEKLLNRPPESKT